MVGLSDPGGLGSRHTPGSESARGLSQRWQGTGLMNPLDVGTGEGSGLGGLGGGSSQGVDGASSAQQQGSSQVRLLKSSCKSEWL